MLRIEDGEWKMAILDPPFSILDLRNARLASEIFFSSLLEAKIFYDRGS
jgi:hypothetical protein